MPVEVPSIKRLKSQAPDSVGRLEANVPSSLMQSNRGEQAISAISGVADAYAKAELEGATLTATDVSTQYKTQRKAHLSELEQIDGAPGEHFAKFDKDSQEWKKGFEEKYKGAPEVTRTLIKQKLAEADALTNAERVSLEGTLQNKYDGKVTKAAVDAGKSSVMGATFAFDPKDKNSVLDYEVAIDSIRKPMLENGVRRKLVTMNEDGTINSIDPILQYEMKKEISDGLKNSIETLNNTGHTDRAEYLMQKYQDELAPDAMAQLLKGGKETKIDQAAYVVLDQIKGKDPASASAWIDKNVTDPAVAEKARSKLATKTAQDSAFKNQSQQSAYDRAWDLIQKRREAGGGKYFTKDQMESDKELRPLLGRMGDMRVKFERSMFRPKESDVTVKSDMYTLAQKADEFYSMDYPALTRSMDGLNDKDSAMFESMWRKGKDPKFTEQKSRYTFMSTELKQQMQIYQDDTYLF